MNIITAVADANLFGPWFKKKETWRAWFAFLKTIFALPMTDDELALYRQCTGRIEAPRAPGQEAWLVVGRRGGKSFIVALIAVYVAAFRDYTKSLSPGERGVVMVLAADRKQARVILRYVRGLLENVPMLARMIEGNRDDGIELDNRVDIEIHTSSFRAVRGYTVVAALCDEIAFWRSEDSANPDAEIIAALKPAMATIPGALLIGLSSPYARRGVLWDAHYRHYGKADSPVLVWQADTRTMNPAVPQRIIDEAYERDPASASAEYGAQFRSDVEAFVPHEIVDSAVIAGRRELPPVEYTTYKAFVDPSGGSQDSFTLAVAHKDGDCVVLDALRERRPPFSPDDVCKEFAALLKSYGLASVTGDRYGGAWPAERFRAHGITYNPAELTRSDLYAELLPLLMGSRVELLDNTKLVTQLATLERRTSRAGKDSIDHPPGGHDDLANAAAGALMAADRKRTNSYNADVVYAIPDSPLPCPWSIP